jgi:hypothetical protein
MRCAVLSDKSTAVDWENASMGDIKLGEPFGMDLTGISVADWNLALQRIIHDLRSDFIYAPHIGFIYRKAGEDLISIVK